MSITTSMEMRIGWVCAYSSSSSYSIEKIEYYLYSYPYPVNMEILRQNDYIFG